MVYLLILESALLPISIALWRDTPIIFPICSYVKISQKIKSKKENEELTKKLISSTKQQVIEPVEEKKIEEPQTNQIIKEKIENQKNDSNTNIMNKYLDQLNDDEPLTKAEISRRLERKITPERVRQIIETAERKIKSSEGIDAFAVYMDKPDECMHRNSI